MKKSLLFLLLLLAAAAVFELLPAVRQARTIIPEDVYAGKSCDCQCVTASRPWYGTFNSWFWLWIAAAPLLMFPLRPDAPVFQKAVAVFASIGLCYLLMTLSLHLFWDIRNGPFVASPDPDVPWQKTWDMPCADIGDSASLSFVLLFGWIPAALYTGLCYAGRRVLQSFLKKRTS